MKIYNFLIPVLIFIFGMVNCGRDLFGLHLEHYPGDMADTRFNNLILEHDYQWLIGNQQSLWDVPFFYPAQNMLAGSDNHLGTFLLYVPFRLLGFDEIRSFQAWVFLLFVLNFYVFYKVARQLGLNAAASSAGAFLFTFSMPVLGSVHHIQTLCKFSFPLVMYFFYRILFHEQKKNLLWFSLSLAHVFYASIYYGLFTLLILLVFLLAALPARPKLKEIFSRKNIYWLPVSVAVLLLLLVPLLLPYMEQEKFSAWYTFDQLLPSMPHPYSYVMPHHGSFFYSWLFNITSKQTDIFWAHIFFVGFVSIILVIAAFYLLWKKQDTAAGHRYFFGISALVLMVLLLLTTAAGHFSLYKYLMEIKAFNHLKVVSRVVLIELFFVGLLVAFALNRFDFSKTKGRLALAALVALVTAEHWMHTGTLKTDTVHNARHRHDYVIKALENNGRYRAFVVLRNGNSEREPYENAGQIDAMAAALQKNIPTLNGYTTVADPSYYNVYTGTRQGVMIWLNYCGMDTVKAGREILFIR